MSAPTIERLLSKGWYGTALCRACSIVTRGWFDYAQVTIMRLIITTPVRKGDLTVTKREGSAGVTKRPGSITIES